MIGYVPTPALNQTARDKEFVAVINELIAIIVDSGSDPMNALSAAAKAVLDKRAVPVSHQIVAVRITRMYESCERTTYYVDLVSSEGFTNTVAAHATGSIYTDHVGLSVEEARDRALIDADTWADFFGLTPTPYAEEGVTYEPSMLMRRYETRRVLAARRAAKERNS